MAKKATPKKPAPFVHDGSGPDVDPKTGDESETTTGSHTGLTLDPKTNEFRAPTDVGLSFIEVVLILVVIGLVIIAIAVF